MRKWLYPLLIVFVAYFIFSNPTQSGSQGRAFVAWVGDLASATGDFLEGLFSDSDPGNNQNLQPNTNSAPAPSGSGNTYEPGDNTRQTTQGGGGNQGAADSDSFASLAAPQTG